MGYSSIAASKMKRVGALLLVALLSTTMAAPFGELFKYQWQC